MKRIITHTTFIAFYRCTYKKLILFVWAMATAFFVTATTYNVTTFTDGTTANTLRGAITAANGSVGPHIINVPAGTYNLTLGQIRFGDVVGQNITIQGTGGIAIINMTSTNRNRIFNINFDIVANVTTYLKNLTLRGGVASDFYGGATDAGGAILCGGPGNVIDISNCTFENNTVSTTQGIYNYGGAITCLVSGALTIDGCTFTGNVDPTLSGARPGNGGAIYYDINVYNGVAASGSVSITNSIFTNNSTGAGGNGGAISIEAALLGVGQNVVVNISKNVFTGNSASTSGRGGAININTDRSTFNINYNRFANNTAAAGLGSGLFVTDQDGNVNATNNWWGCNSGPTGCADKAEQIAGNNGTGVLTASPHLQLRASANDASLCAGSSTTVTAFFATNLDNNSIAASNLSAFIGLPISFIPALGTISNTQVIQSATGTATATYTAGSTASTGTINAVVDNVPSSDVTARASITVNTVSSFTSQPTVSPSTGICTGSTITFSASYSNIGSVSASSAQWFKGLSTTPLSVGSTGTGSVVTSTSTGTTSASITIANVAAADSGNYLLKIMSSNRCGTTTSNTVLANVSSPIISTASSTGTKTINANNFVITNSSCNIIATVQPSGASPVSGSTTATATLQSSVQVSSNGSPYVPRYYDIIPTTNASAATATLTLYFTQAEFTAFNAYPSHGLNLPVDGTDAQNYKANIRIYVFHSSPNGGGNFPGPTETIDPSDADIVYNEIYGRWEVKFNTVGFSRYYLASAGSTILPLNSIALTGHTDGNTAWLAWKVTGEKDVNHYEIERSINGSQFSTIGQVAIGSTYTFADQPIEKVVYYYRIKAVDKDNRMTYSTISAISLKKGGLVARVLPNPFIEKLQLNISTTLATTAELRLLDLGGRVLIKKVVTLQVGTNAVTLNDLNELAKGTYQLQVNSNSLHESIKVVKAE